MTVAIISMLLISKIIIYISRNTLLLSEIADSNPIFKWTSRYRPEINFF